MVDWLGGLRAVGRKLEVGEREEREERVGEQWRRLLRIAFRLTQETQNHRLLKPVRLIQLQPFKKTNLSHLSKKEVHPSFKDMQHSDMLCCLLTSEPKSLQLNQIHD